MKSKVEPQTMVDEVELPLEVDEQSLAAAEVEVQNLDEYENDPGAEDFLDEDKTIDEFEAAEDEEIDVDMFDDISDDAEDNIEEDIFDLSDDELDEDDLDIDDVPMSDLDMSVLRPLITKGRANKKILKQDDVLDYLERIKFEEDRLDEIIEGLERAGIEVIDEKEEAERERDRNKKAEAFNDLCW